jgi:hypothetical protein
LLLSLKKLTVVADHNVVEAADKATEAHAVEGHNEVTEAVEPITLL